MPLSGAQLAALVERARHKAPPVSPPQPAAQRPVRARQAKPAPSAAQSPPEPQQPVQAVVPTPPPEHTAEAKDFPVGWELKKESWHFHPVLRHLPAANGARRILAPALADPTRKG